MKVPERDESPDKHVQYWREKRLLSAEAPSQRTHGTLKDMRNENERAIV